MFFSSVHKRRQRLFLRSALIAFAAVAPGGFFTWGFLVHRDHLFPHRYLHRAALALGLVRQTQPVPVLDSHAVELEDLVGLPYVQDRPDPRIGEQGVHVSKGRRAQEGLTLVLARQGSESSAVLLRLDGRPAWRWRLPGVEAPWLAQPLADGRIVVLDQERAISEHGRDGRMLWSTAGRFHHSLQVLPSRIVALRKVGRTVSRVHPSAQVTDSEIVILDRSGLELASFSLVEILLDSPLAALLPTLSDDDVARVMPGTKVQDVVLDALHANHAAYLEGGAETPFSKPGFLVSLRNLNLLLYVEENSRRILWAWGPGRLRHPHHPSRLANGNLLVVSSEPGQSEILEVDPREFHLVWNYREAGFATEWGGSAQGLRNGNILVTNSAHGRAFEITRTGAVVWRWANPTIPGSHTRRGVYRLIRLEKEELPFLSEATAAPNTHSRPN